MGLVDNSHQKFTHTNTSPSSSQGHLKGRSFIAGTTHPLLRHHTPLVANAPEFHPFNSGLRFNDPSIHHPNEQLSLAAYRCFCCPDSAEASDRLLQELCNRFLEGPSTHQEEEATVSRYVTKQEENEGPRDSTRSCDDDGDEDDDDTEADIETQRPRSNLHSIQTTASSGAHPQSCSETKGSTSTSKGILNISKPFQQPVYHSVSPASLACRKRLTMTSCRSSKAVKRIMQSLRELKKRGDWDGLMKTTLYFCCCEKDVPECQSSIRATTTREAATSVKTAAEDETDGPPSADESSQTRTTHSVGVSTKIAEKPSTCCPHVPRSTPPFMGYTDFAVMCASLFLRVTCRSPGPPPVLFPARVRGPGAGGGPPLSEGAKQLRQVLCDLQTLLLMCMATKLDMQPSEQLRLKHLAGSCLFALVWHPNILEALAPVFFNVAGHNSNDCFCAFLIHWGGTGILQLIFEVFVIVLAKRARWRAVLWLLSCTSIGEGLLLPSICLLDAPNAEPFLPEVADIESCRSEILSRLRFPVGAITDVILDLCTYQMPFTFHKLPWPFKTHPHDLILSLLPIVLCKQFSDEVSVYRGWHDRAKDACPIKSYAPEAVYELLEKQVDYVEGERKLMTENDLHMDHVLDEVIPAFIFMGDPRLGPKYLQLLPGDGCNGATTESEPQVSSLSRGAAAGCCRNTPNVKLSFIDNEEDNQLNTWRPSHPAAIIPPEITAFPEKHPMSSEEDNRQRLRETYLMNPAFVELWRQLPDHPEAAERCNAVVELAGRICETFFVQNKQSPYAEIIESNTRESLLQMSKRTVGELTGCLLGRVDLCYLRLLESFETVFGMPSQMSGLVGPRKTFSPSLNLSHLIHRLTLLPWMDSRNRQRTPARQSSFYKSAPSRRGGEGTGSKTILDQDKKCTSDSFIYPTLLPVHVARMLPAWLSARIFASPHEEGKRQALGGWRVLGREILVAASRILPKFPPNPQVAPHLDNHLLHMFLNLYVETGNPRALHLLTKLAITNESKEQELQTQLVSIVKRARKSKFVLVADAVSHIALFEHSTNVQLAELVLEVYMSAEDGVRALRFIESFPEDSAIRAALKPYEPQVMEIFNSMQGESRQSKTGVVQESKEEKLRSSLAVVKGLAAANDVAGAVAYFHELRESPGGILDISVANKIMHLCVTNNHLEEAEQILSLMRSDAHNEINGMDFIPGACVRPDVVTCNIIIKGFAKQKPPRLDEIDDMIQHMEDPFHLGGDGVKADQVTFNTAINAAVSAGNFEKAWEYFQMMRQRSIRIDGFTCSILVKQLGPNTNPSILEEVCQLVDELDPCEDAVLLSSMVDVYDKLKDTTKLKKVLDRYSSRVANPTPYAIATLIKGYGRCGRLSKAAALLKKLEERSDVRWTSYILNCAVECFTMNGDLTQAFAMAEKARALHIQFSDTQYSLLIRACCARQRYTDALRIYQTMTDHDLHPCTQTYMQLLQACIQNDDFDSAIRILDDMSKHGDTPPDLVTYSTTIKGLCDRGAMDKAMLLFQSLPSRGLTPDIVTYNTILEGYTKEGNAEKVESVFKDLINNKISPTCYTLTILVKFYGRRRKIDRVLTLVETLPLVYNFQLDTFAFTATIAAFSWNGRLDEAIKYLFQMRQSFGAGARTYGTLIHGSIKHHNWQSLEVVLRCATEDNSEIEKRDLCVLRGLLREWNLRTISPKWRASGFDQQAAAAVQAFLSTQKKGMAPCVDTAVRHTNTWGTCEEQRNLPQHDKDMNAHADLVSPSPKPETSLLQPS